MSHPTAVLIVGAGPAGLLLAGDLATAGVATTVLERRDEESNLTRAFAVHARTLELLDARGLAEELVATGAPVGSLGLFSDLELDLSHLPSRFPYLLVTPQYHTERLLETRAVAAGAEIVRGAEVVGLRQDSGGVEVEVRGGDGGTSTRRAPWLVGADGVGSTVRAALGLPFPGHSAVQSVILADVRLGDPPTEELTVDARGEGFAFVTSFGDGWYRVIAWDRHRQLPDDAPVSLEEVREATRKSLGTDFGMHDPRWLSRFHSDERQVPSYRAGRVFLAGDAAHVHSPAGGQGMNTGMQDAANLSWKLAAAVQGWAPQGLLDTYQAERHPVGRRVLRLSGGLLRAALLRNRVLRAARDTVGRAALRPGPVARRLAGNVSGLAIAYPAARDAGPGAGRRAPDVGLDGGAGAPTRLYEALRAGRFVLVSGRAAVPEGWAGRVDRHTPADPATPAMLVRPDGYVAWSARGPATGSGAKQAGPSDQMRDRALRKALLTWSGAPSAGQDQQPAPGRP